MISARRALCVTLAVFAAAVAAAVCLSAPAWAGPYVNPTPAEIRTKLHDAAVANAVPPKILYAIAFQESTWRQFDATGDPLIGSDGLGIGIMQVTSYGSYDIAKLKTDIDYNIAAGVQILLEKWGYAPTVIPVIGDGDPRCYENWFYAVWAYNGWTARNEYPYQIWTHIRDGHGLWTSLPVSEVPRPKLVDGFGVTIATPLPAHYWSPVPLPKPELSAPRVQTRVAAGDRMTVSGTLSPKHPAGGHSVEIRCYRKSGSVWVLRRTVLTTNRDSGAVTRYAATFGMAKTGRWKLQAYAAADADHAAVTSAPAYVTVL